MSILGREAEVEAVTVWVHVDPNGRPKKLPEEFHALFGSAAGGRLVNARQSQDPVTVDAPETSRFDWWPRATDLDVLGHVNNAVAWSLLEQLRAVRLMELGSMRGSPDDLLDRPFRAEVEYRDAVDQSAVDGGRPLVAVYRVGGDRTDLTLWSADEDIVHVTATVSTLEEERAPG